MADQPTTLWDIARLFLRLGTTAFGGPAAHIAMLEREVVTRRRWLTEAEFLDHLGASNLIPGPTSTELVLHIGSRRAGWPGLVVEGACFIFPAALMVGVMAWAYVRFGALPAVAGLLYGVKPVVIAVILQALWKLGNSAVKSAWLATVAMITLGLGLVGVNALLVLAAGGLLAVAGLFSQLRNRPSLLGTRDKVCCSGCGDRNSDCCIGGTVADLPDLRQDRGDGVRKRLRVAGVSACRTG
jgi:chromate transporter